MTDEYPHKIWCTSVPHLFPVVIPGLRAGTCCVVLRGSLLIVCKQVRLLFV